MDSKHSDDLHYLWWLALTTVAGMLIYLLSPILTPFMLAGIVAYICNPLMTRLAAGKISRTLGALLVIVLLLGMFVALLLIMLPLFEKEVSRLIERGPAYLETIKTNLIPWLEVHLGISLQLDIATLKQLSVGTVAQATSENFDALFTAVGSQKPGVQ